MKCTRDWEGVKGVASDGLDLGWGAPIIGTWGVSSGMLVDRPLWVDR